MRKVHGVWTARKGTVRGQRSRIGGNRNRSLEQGGLTGGTLDVHRLRLSRILEAEVFRPSLRPDEVADLDIVGFLAWLEEAGPEELEKFGRAGNQAG